MIPLFVVIRPGNYKQYVFINWHILHNGDNNTAEICVSRVLYLWLPNLGVGIKTVLFRVRAKSVLVSILQLICILLIHVTL